MSVKKWKVLESNLDSISQDSIMHNHRQVPPNTSYYPKYIFPIRFVFLIPNFLCMTMKLKDIKMD
jgi:hypothetical protein